MRINFFTFLLICLVVLSCTTTYQAHAQLPPLQWSTHYGGNGVDIPFVIKFTSDGGTVVAGYTDSRNGDVSPQPSRDYWDLWIVKLDKCGSIQWERSFGGTGYESARDVVQTADGGYMVLGETNSTNGGVIAGFGGTKDIWLLKLSAAGALQWQRRYGGSGLDIGNRIALANDGGYLIAASTSSNDGDVRGNHGTGGYTDGLLMKISSTGTVEWSKCYGGSRNEELFDIAIINSTIYVAGFANSIDGDIPPNQKNYDVWLLALDGSGNKIFSKIYGGSQNDVAYSMTTGADGSLTMAGYTTSSDGDVSGARGSQDFWVLNVSQQGRLNWQQVLGGTDAEYAKSIIMDSDSGYIVGGVSYSDDGDITDERGEGDFWTIKLSATGEVAWQQSWGGRDNDHLRSMIHNPATQEYYFAGDSDSRDGDWSNSMGDADFAIIKLKRPEILVLDTAVCFIENYIPVEDTLFDQCGYDSAYVTYQPVLLGGPFMDTRRADTIFVGEQVTLHGNGNGVITWNPHPTLSCSDCTDPVASPLMTTIYTAVNSLPTGCRVTDRYTVVVLSDAVVMVPTAFTPNGDGKNDVYGPIGKVPEGYRMQIYNRNGEIVFRSQSLGQRWNGAYMGKPQPMGVYIYLIDYKDLQNKSHQQKGTLTLIR